MFLFQGLSAVEAMVMLVCFLSRFDICIVRSDSLFNRASENLSLGPDQREAPIFIWLRSPYRMAMRIEFDV